MYECDSCGCLLKDGEAMLCNECKLATSLDNEKNEADIDELDMG